MINCAYVRSPFEVLIIVFVFMVAFGNEYKSQSFISDDLSVIWSLWFAAVSGCSGKTCAKYIEIEIFFRRFTT